MSFFENSQNQNQGLFGNQQGNHSTNLIGHQQRNQGTNIFGNQQGNQDENLFGNQQANQRINLFGNQQGNQSPNLFGANNNNPGGILFGNNANNGNNMVNLFDINADNNNNQNNNNNNLQQNNIFNQNKPNQYLDLNNQKLKNDLEEYKQILQNISNCCDPSKNENMFKDYSYIPIPKGAQPNDFNIYKPYSLINGQKIIVNDYNIWEKACKNNVDPNKYFPTQISSVDDLLQRYKNLEKGILKGMAKTVETQKSLETLNKIIDNEMNNKISELKNNYIKLDKLQLDLSSKVAEYNYLLGTAKVNESATQQIKENVKKINDNINKNNMVELSEKLKKVFSDKIGGDNKDYIKEINKNKINFMMDSLVELQNMMNVIDNNAKKNLNTINAINIEVDRILKKKMNENKYSNIISNSPLNNNVEIMEEFSRIEKNNQIFKSNESGLANDFKNNLFNNNNSSRFNSEKEEPSLKKEINENVSNSLINYREEIMENFAKIEKYNKNILKSNENEDELKKHSDDNLFNNIFNTEKKEEQEKEELKNKNDGESVSNSLMNNEKAFSYYVINELVNKED